jgi:hypothetical protein
MLTDDLSATTIVAWRYWCERTQELGVNHDHRYAQLCFECAEILRKQQVQNANR